MSKLLTGTNAVLRINGKVVRFANGAITTPAPSIEHYALLSVLAKLGIKSAGGFSKPLGSHKEWQAMVLGQWS